MLETLPEYSVAALTLIGTGIGGYLLAYFQQKAKNLALKEDISVLESEKKQN